jgi:hypothetical protein
MENENSISKEIDELIGSLAGEPSSASTPTPSPSGDPTPPPKETPPEPSKETPPPSGEPTPTPPAKKEGEPTPVPSGEPTKETLPSSTPASVEETPEELRERIKLLLGRIEELTPVPGATPTPEPKPSEKSEGAPPPKETPPAPVKVEEIDFLTNLNIDDVIDDPKKLNALLNSVYQRARSDAKEDAAKAVLTALPGLVSSEVKTTNDTSVVVNEFYSHNEDLSSVKRTVMAVAAQVHAEKPEWGFQEVLKESATRTRTMLGIKPSTKTKDPKFEDPAFVDKGGSRTPSRTGPQTIQDEISELMTH